MSTSIRPELSEKNKYWIEKHRYYELKHFCLQYDIWQKEYRDLDGYAQSSLKLNDIFDSNSISDPTSKCVEKREYYFDRMKMVEQTAVKADPELSAFIFIAVTKGYTYNILKLNCSIPCCRDVFYDRYRKFFWLLDEVRK